MLNKIKSFLTHFFYTYILGKRPAVLPSRGTVRPVTMGADGPLAVDALLVRDTDRDVLILVVDADLHDVPVWADWDAHQNTVGIAQQNGAYATLAIGIEKENQGEIKSMKRITVVTKVAEMNVIHQVPFIVRDY